MPKSDTYRRTSGLFNSDSNEPFKLSRSKIDLFLECQKCFYLDRKMGISRPQGPAFTLNVAVDHLLKKEFDIHRIGKTTHPLMKSYNIDAIPYAHKDLNDWRENFTGIRFLHKSTNFLITGAIDDVWVNKKEELVVVDYKATAKAGRIESLDDTKWNRQYKRQMEIYQWLFRQNGFNTSDTGYFVYVNGKKDRKSFDGKLEFDVTVIPYNGSDRWIPKTLESIKKTLLSNLIPKASEDCQYCRYNKLVEETAGKKLLTIKTKKDSTQKKTLF